MFDWLSRWWKDRNKTIVVISVKNYGYWHAVDYYVLKGEVSIAHLNAMKKQTETYIREHAKQFFKLPLYGEAWFKFKIEEEAMTMTYLYYPCKVTPPGAACLIRRLRQKKSLPLDRIKDL